MANSIQARKRSRQSKKANLHNSSLRSKFRTAIKAVKNSILLGDKNKSIEIFKKSSKIMDIIADKKIFHKNKSARHKSRLSSAISEMKKNI